MRFFQPLNQHGYARMLAETRSKVVLSPGLISIEKPDEIIGYSSFFEMPIPSESSQIESNYHLHWNFPEDKSEKVLAKSSILSLQQFYPSYVDSNLFQEDYKKYVEEFVSLPDLHNQIFTLPINYITSQLLDQVLKTDFSFITLVGLDRLFKNQRKLTETLVNLRERISPDIAIYLPGSISPSLYSFLVYTGIDFFDNSLAYHISKNGYFLTEDSVYPLDKHPACYCTYCTNEPKNTFKHNEMILKNAIERSRYALKHGILRTLVEQDIHRNITIAAALRHLDQSYGESFRRRTPLISSSPVKCVGEESFHRPVIAEYRERIKSRYQTNTSTKILLLLPCSARKPYSFSRSHMLFRNAIRKAGKDIFSVLSELIITSPLSVVPRELEDIYPSKYYDIPVSGSWSEEEIRETANLLLSTLNQLPDDVIIVNHMHGFGYDDIIEIIKEKRSFNVVSTAEKSSPTSHDSLMKLTESLVSILSEFSISKQRGISHKIRKLQAVADFQYGSGTGRILFAEDIKLKGKYPKNIQIFKNKLPIATLSQKTGYLSIQPRFAQDISHLSLNKLYFGAEYVSGSNIYAPGLINADKTILPNDEIFVMFENNVIATAKALVSGADMSKMTSGILAEVKKKIKVNK